MNRRSVTAMFVVGLMSFAVTPAAFADHEAGHEAPAPATAEEACRADHPYGDCGTHAESTAESENHSGEGQSHFDREQKSKDDPLF
jgi:hypothetical protein